jgi:hypothetical protein
MCYVNIKSNFCVQVKNKTCVVNIIMRLIPWKCPSGSETVILSNHRWGISPVAIRKCKGFPRTPRTSLDTIENWDEQHLKPRKNKEKVQNRS